MACILAGSGSTFLGLFCCLYVLLLAKTCASYVSLSLTNALEDPGNPRVGNFIIGASGSDKQMLCASSGARAALNIAAEKSKQKR